LVRAVLWTVLLAWLLVLSLQEANGAYIGAGVLVWGAWFWRS
jgi:hypothetical protein